VIPEPLVKRPGGPREARWQEEAAFFDAHAEACAAPLDPRVAERYRRAARFWFNKEWRFRWLGDLRGHDVLDVGCGTGDNALLLALRGGRVTGVDVSPRSIEIARARASAGGAEPAPRFVCAPIEEADLPPRSFDVIWADGLLHHVIPELPAVLARLAALARPGARFVFSEPVNRLPWLRRLRLALPVPVDGTPGERPLEDPELLLLRRVFPGLRVRTFQLASRLVRFVLPGGYEVAPVARRAAADLLCLWDWAALSLPGIERAGGMAVLYGRLPVRPG
jgi:SAM-dependent methyltransferase